MPTVSFHYLRNIKLSFIIIPMIYNTSVILGLEIKKIKIRENKCDRTIKALDVQHVEWRTYRGQPHSLNSKEGSRFALDIT